MSIIKLNPNFVECACGNVMEKMPGDIIKGQKDERGQPISAEAAKHMADNRIRCNACGKILKSSWRIDGSGRGVA